MRGRRPSSIALNSGQQRVYRSFEDWQSEQQSDTRTPEERGLSIGSSVMWRHKHNGIIVTDRATVQAISGDMLTIVIKDVQERTCTVNIREIVASADDRNK